MQSKWNDAVAREFLEAAGNDEAERILAQRVYTSRLVGSDPDLVLHGGGNTSVKTKRTDGHTLRDVIHVKGSGWDLETIEGPGLPALWLDPLLGARNSKKLSDPEMVKLLRANLLESDAPNPSVETLLHAFMPHKFVDHTHATAVLVLANQPNSAEIAREIYGNRIGVVPYVMPGFDLSLATADTFERAPHVEGLWLVNHGLFTFDDDARRSYELMIEFVTAAEKYLADSGVILSGPEANEGANDEVTAFSQRLAARLQTRQGPFTGGASLDFRTSPSIRAYVSREDIEEVSGRGTVTPDHVIRIKPFPLILELGMSDAQIDAALDDFADRYTEYFKRNEPYAEEPKTMLDPLPRQVLLRDHGLFGVGKSAKEAAVVGDLLEQTARTINAAEAYGRFTPISERDLFDMEYWSLEQAKLAKA